MTRKTKNVKIEGRSALKGRSLCIKSFWSVLILDSRIFLLTSSLSISLHVMHKKHLNLHGGIFSNTFKLLRTLRWFSDSFDLRCFYAILWSKLLRSSLWWLMKSGSGSSWSSSDFMTVFDHSYKEKLISSEFVCKSLKFPINWSKMNKLLLIQLWKWLMCSTK